MPGFDGTGPRGMGPMTGGGRGFCNPYSPSRATGFMPRAQGATDAQKEVSTMFNGAGYGGRGGRGRRNMYYLTGLPGWMRGMSPGGPCAQYLQSGQWPTPQMQAAWQSMQAGQPTTAGDPQTQLSSLKAQSQILQQQLDQVQARIAELER